MKNIESLTTSTLLLVRQWLIVQSNSMQIEREFTNLATKCIKDVDKELWHRLISNRTPWGEVPKARDESSSIAFEDPNFEDTIKSFKENDNVNE